MCSQGRGRSEDRSVLQALSGRRGEGTDTAAGLRGPRLGEGTFLGAESFPYLTSERDRCRFQAELTRHLYFEAVTRKDQRSPETFLGVACGGFWRFSSEPQNLVEGGEEDKKRTDGCVTWPVRFYGTVPQSKQMKKEGEVELGSCGPVATLGR